MKKFVSLLLALVMVFSLAACTGGNDETSTPPVDNTDNANETTPPDEGDSYTGPDWEAIAEMDWDDASQAIYDWVYSEFYDVYTEAKAEVNDLDLRLALMGIAEAKFLETATFLPIQTTGGSSQMSRVLPRTITSVAWGLDEYRFHTLLVAEELTKPEDRTALTALWGEAETAADYVAAARAYAEEHGYTISDTYNLLTSWHPSSWDVLATSQSSDSYNIAGTYDNLLEYDAKDVQQPGLATSYDVSADALTYTFHIREGVNWVDQQGSVIAPVTANDWVTGAMHLADNNSALGYLFGSDGGCGIKNWDAYQRSEVGFDEVGVKAIDDYTLEYTLEAPFPPFTTMLGYGCFAPLNYDFYKSQGGTFGAEGDEYTAGNYGKTPENIAYCGPFLISNFTSRVQTSYVANPQYWNAEAVTIKSHTKYYTDGSDPTRSYTDCKNGTIAACGFTAATRELAQSEIPEGEDGTYFDVYGYTSAVGGSTFGGWFNLYRQSFANYNDETKGISPQGEEDQLRTQSAMANQHFRMAIAMGIDRGAFLAPSRGEAMKNLALRNSYVGGDFASLSNDATVDINGTSTTFKAGTNLAEIVQAQLTADGYPIKVWDPSGNEGAGSGDGFDGWYSAANAKAQLDLAIAELAQVGVEISAEKPIYIDIPYESLDQTQTNQVNALKQSLENSLEGMVIINLVDYPDDDSFEASYYRINSGADANYNLEPYAGWGPDYGDPQTYLDTVLPYGYMTKNMGLWGD